MVVGCLLAEEVSSWNQAWRLQGKSADFQSSEASHEGRSKVLARGWLSGEQEKGAQILLLLLTGSCLLPEPGNLHGSAVQEEFPLPSLGTKP